MGWICPNCETENPDRLKNCEVCDSSRETSPVDKLKEELKEKFYDAAYKSFIRNHYALLDAADKGDVSAQYQVAEWFNRGGSDGSSNEYSMIAATWYQKAAMKGHIDAQVKLASCYEKGRGVPQIKDEAMKWYKKASNRGDWNAKLNYLRLKYSSSTYKEVNKCGSLLLYNADVGNRNSQYQLGEWFSCHNSMFSYRKEAFFWYEKAAKNGHGGAMYKLGECCETGFGVYTNLDEALSWYKKAAKSGNKSACLKLAKSYLYGKMVNKNVNLALKWFEQIGSEICGVDLYNIGYAYDVGDSVPKDKTKAVEYYRKAASKNNVDALYRLGICYTNGTGVRKNLTLAKQYYRLAASLGNSNANQASLIIETIMKKQRRDGIIIVFFGLFISAALGLGAEGPTTLDTIAKKIMGILLGFPVIITGIYQMTKK